MAQVPALATLDNYKLARLANEVAMDIREIPDILIDYGLSHAQYVEIERIPFYRNTLEQSRLEWNSAKSVHERLKLQSAIMLEEAFPTLGARMRNANEPLPAAIETAKLLAKITGLGEAARSVGGSEKFTITINLGADTKDPNNKIKIEKDITPSPPQIEALGDA